MKLVNNKDKCCGCGLCALKCPKKAIEMKEDKYGFVYPYIDEDKCINCGICKKVCNYKKNIQSDFNKETFVVVAKDDETLKTTASGGAFTAIASSFIENGGVVFGCSLEQENEKFKVMHIKVDNVKDLDKLKGSKYVQSDINNIYMQIMDELNNGKKVLFSGTPCQVSAIKAFTKNHEHLYTVGLICHGGSSNKMFNDFIDFLNKKNGIKIINFIFRDKTKGWGLFAKITYKKNKKVNTKIIPCIYLSYYQMFIDSLTYRDNCYTCPFASENRVEDITLGDYWGIEYVHPEYLQNKLIDSKKGVSCLIVNSYKGKNLLDNCNRKMNILSSTFDKAKSYNKNLYEPSIINSKRKEILDIYSTKDYFAVNKWYKKNNMKKIFIRSIWFKLPYVLKVLIKRIIKTTKKRE